MAARRRPDAEPWNIHPSVGVESDGVGVVELAEERDGVRGNEILCRYWQTSPRQEDDALRTVSAPVLLSEGSATSRFAALVVDQLAGVLPNAHRVVMDGAGHVPHTTHPDAYVDMLNDFVRST